MAVGKLLDLSGQYHGALFLTLGPDLYVYQYILFNLLELE